MTHRRILSARQIDERGAVAALYALSLFGLVAIGGVAFDYARLAGMDSELQNAADQAALAGASLLEKKDGACARAANAAIGLLSNQTLLANDGSGIVARVNNGATIAVANDACTSVAGIRFYKDKNKAALATTDEDAAFIEVAVDDRVANYAFTPVAGAFFGTISARALAGLGSSVCKVPPIMICHPDPSPTADYDWSALRGIGIAATGHSPGNSSGKDGAAGSGSAGTTWSPGNFGFLQVEDPDANNKNAALLRALAYANPPIDCTPVGDNKVSTGNPQGLYDAINTRFDIYDFNSNGGSTLSSCRGTNCPPASNVVKDFQNSNTNFNGQNACKIHNNGWKLPDNEYNPVSGTGPYYQDSDGDGAADITGEAVDAIGLTRDLCHYTTFGASGWCTGSESTGRFGNGTWGRADYFKKNHGSSPSNWPSDWATITRYNTYRWELGLYGTPAGSVPNTSAQRGRPVCYNGSPSGGDIARRVMTVAVVTNCAQLNGTSQPVVIDDWIDVFLVEPSTDDAKRHNAYKDSIYVEVIGRSQLAGDGSYASQQIRRDVPYLVQ